MADSHPDVENDDTCAICFEVFRQPVKLPCEHSFCRECIDLYSQQGTERARDGSVALTQNSGSKKISCPVCRSVVDLGENGIASLPVDDKLVNILEKYQGNVEHEEDALKCSICEEAENQPAEKFCSTCCAFYCQKCVAMTHPMRGPMKRHKLLTVEEYLFGQTNEGVIQAQDEPCCVYSCEEHDEPFSLHCGICDELLCTGCVLKHEGHSMYAISTAYRKNKASFQKETDRMKEVKHELDTFIVEMTQLQEQIKTKKKLHIAEGEKAYKKAMEDLENWSKKYTEDVTTRHEPWSQDCEGTLKNLKMKQEEVQGFLSSSTEILTSPEVGFLKYSKPMKTRIVRLTQAVKDELQSRRQKTKDWRKEMDSDRVTLKHLYLQEDSSGELVRVPGLKFLEKNSSVWYCWHNPFETGVTILTQKFQAGRHYWEILINFDEVEGDISPSFSVGIVHNDDKKQGSNLFNDVTSCCITCSIQCSDNYCMCQYRLISDKRDILHTVGKHLTGGCINVHLGFYLDCEQQIFTIIDCYEVAVVHTFADINFSLPVRPVFIKHTCNTSLRSVRLVAGEIPKTAKFLSKIVRKRITCYSLASLPLPSTHAHARTHARTHAHTHTTKKENKECKVKSVKKK